MADVLLHRPLAGANGAPATVGAAASGRGRLEALEGLRFVAALGIVWFHMGAPGMVVASSALSLFLVLSTFFAVLSLAKTGPRIFWQLRFQKILVPWLAWCVFYLAVNAERLGVPEALQLENPWALLVGPSIHLWFLPFVFLCGIPICLLVPRIRSRAALAVLAALAVPLSVGTLYIAEGLTLPPFEQWTVAIMPTAYGLLAAIAARLAAPRVPLIFLALTICGLLAVEASEALVPAVLGIGAFELGRRVTWRAPILAELGRTAFGIYLVHPFFILVFFKFGGVSGTVPSVLLVFAASALASAVMVRLPVLRSLV